MTYRLALIGFGNVGTGFARIMAERRDVLSRRFGIDLELVAVSDLVRGSVYDPAGIDPDLLLAAVSAGASLEQIGAPHRGWDALRTIRECEADVIVELTFTDLETGEPALSHVQAALESGKHVLTTNKGPTALRYPDLAALAAENGVEIGVEGTVMSGTPALRMGMDYLAAAGIRRIEGILNGTTNYILSKMETGAEYEAALSEAQQLGYAEADPTGDVEGFDAAGKVVILANLLIGLPLTMDDVDRQGITELTPADLADARAAGERWKLVGEVDTRGARATAAVRPVRLPCDHPLAAIAGATNAITYTTDLLGQVTLVGPGAGRTETGFALIVDLLAIHRRRSA